MKTQKGIIHLGLILILLIFGIGALVFVMYKTNSLPAVTTSSPTPEAVVIDTSDWKTYVDEKYHYRLNYPKEWNLEKQTGENPIYGHYQYLEFKSMDDNFVFIFGLRYKSEENISLDNRTGTPAGEFIEGDNLQIDDIILSEKRIVYKNNTNTVFFATNGNDKNYEVLADFAYIGSDPYYIERYDIVKTDQYKIVRKILSTFEFIGSTKVNGDWQSYENKQYGFRFSHPKYLTANSIGYVGGPVDDNATYLATISDPNTVREGTDANFDGFSIYAVPLGSQSFDQYVDSQIDIFKSSPRTDLSALKPKSEIAIDGHKAYYITPNTSHKIIFIQKDSQNALVISRIYASSSFIDVFESILRTIEFFAIVPS